MLTNGNRNVNVSVNLPLMGRLSKLKDRMEELEHRGFESR